jgi:hypothetical protein
MNNTRATYFQLGDGFEFILPMRLADANVTLKFMANSIFDFEANEWKKYGITVYDADCVQYQWRSAEMESRRKSFENVPIIDYEGLRLLGYMVQHAGSSAYLMNKSEYSKRRSAFVEKVKALPTTINLGVDEELKRVIEEEKVREEAQKEEDALGEVGYGETATYMFRRTGRTYVQLGDGFEFVIERPVESVNQMMKLSSTTLYDMEENKWCKYRSTIYKDAEGRLHSKFYPNEADRPRNFENVPVLTYEDLTKAGYMNDWGEEAMVRYFFNYQEYQRRRKAANLIFDDIIARERETGQ